MRMKLAKIMRLTASITMLAVLIGIAILTQASAATVTVSPGSGSIQAAIDSAVAGDTVYVKPGMYSEHLVINKPITLQGEDKTTTIINGGGSGNVIYASGINNIIISDITVKDGETGIEFDRSTNNLVKNVIVTNNVLRGINFGDRGSSSNTIQNVEAYSNGLGVIGYAGTNNLKVLDSKLYGNKEDGVLIGWSSGWVIENTACYSNGRDGVGIDTASGGTIQNCTIYNNTEGVGSGGLGESGNRIVGNTIYSNERGVRFDSNNRDCYVIENKIYDNQVGIYLYQWAQYPSYNNHFYHNDLRNIKNCDAPGDTVLNNKWDNGYPNGGNFYSDYAGVDQFKGAGQNEVGSDGIGDSSYTVAQSNVDNYPLMKPWHSNFPSGNEPPVANAGGAYQTDEGTPVTFDASLSSDPEGAALQYRWDLENNGTWTEWSTEPKITYTWADDWSGTAKLEVSDGILTGSDTATVTIRNVSPVAGKIVSSVDPFLVNTMVTASCNFTDLGLEDTHTAVWKWGDDTSSDGAISGTNEEKTVTGEHAYAKAGVYRVALNIVDDNGGSVITESENYIVVYDPQGGFVTGGGWINSPAGAYVPNEAMTGKATFGFVSKYIKGATTPTGNTEFQFKIADLNFHSESYDWLVVAGSKAMYKGTGTINGQGNYGFMLSAVDKDGADKFRIKIWNKDTDQLVYDNERDIAEDAAPSTVIGGGSIVVHTEK